MFDTAPLAPYFAVGQSQVTISNSPPQRLCPADVTRILLVVTNGNQTQININLSGSTSTSPAMFILSANQTLELWWSRHGIICQSELWVSSPAPYSNNKVTITSVSWRPENM